MPGESGEPSGLLDVVTLLRNAGVEFVVVGVSHPAQEHLVVLARIEEPREHRHRRALGRPPLRAPLRREVGPQQQAPRQCQRFFAGVMTREGSRSG
jgi:hypothetical protein